MRNEFFKQVREEVLELAQEMALEDAIEHILISYAKPWEWIEDMPSQRATPNEFLEWWHKMLL